MTRCVGEHMPADTTRDGGKRELCFSGSIRYVKSVGETMH